MTLSLLKPELPKGDATNVAKTIARDTGAAAYNVAVIGAGVLLVGFALAWAARKGWLANVPGINSAAAGVAAFTDDLGTRLG